MSVTGLNGTTGEILRYISSNSIVFMGSEVTIFTINASASIKLQILGTLLTTTVQNLRKEQFQPLWYRIIETASEWQLGPEYVMMICLGLNKTKNLTLWLKLFYCQ